MNYRVEFQWLRETIRAAIGVVFWKVEIKDDMAPFQVVFAEGDAIELVLSYNSVIGRDTDTVSLLAIKHQGMLGRSIESKCRSRCDAMFCCRLAGHDRHHEDRADGNRVGWVEDDAGGQPIRVAICVTDTPTVIAQNFAMACQSRIASRAARHTLACDESAERLASQGGGTLSCVCGGTRQLRQVAGKGFYGAMPHVLPETLPAGTRTLRTSNNFVASSELKLMSGFGFNDRYSGFVEMTGGEFDGVKCRGVTLAGDVDWSSVPIRPQEAKPVDPNHDRATNLDAAIRTMNGGKLYDATVQEAKPAAESIIIAAPIDPSAPPYIITRVCRDPDCSSPATNGDFCAYCATRHGPISEQTKALHTERFTVSVEARSRIAKADARARHVPTKAERELAKPHPWSNYDD